MQKLQGEEWNFSKQRLQYVFYVLGPDVIFCCFPQYIFQDIYLCTLNIPIDICFQQFKGSNMY